MFPGNVRSPARPRPAHQQPTYRNSTATFVSVIQTPHAIGIPTAAHAKTDETVSALAREVGITCGPSWCPCAARTSSADMNHLCGTGRTSRLAINPITSNPASRYSVTSYTDDRGTPAEIAASRI